MADAKYTNMLSVNANKVNATPVTDSSRQIDAAETNTQISAIKDLINDVTNLNDSFSSIQTLTADPTNPKVGEIWLRTDL